MSIRRFYVGAACGRPFLIDKNILLRGRPQAAPTIFISLLHILNPLWYNRLDHKVC